MTLEYFIMGLLFGWVLRLRRKEKELERRIAELEHDNARLEGYACRLAASLTAAKRLLSERKKGT